jgi:hypothetical protein
VGNPTRQFVLLFGTLLFFSNGGSLFAGMICQRDFGQTPEDNVVRDFLRPHAEDTRSEVKASAFAIVTQHERAEPAAARNEALQLLGKSFNGPPETPSRPRPESDGLDGADRTRQAPPRPSAPSERGESGAAGTVPTIGPKEQQSGLFTRSAPPTPAGEGRLIFHKVRVVPDAPVARLFRPPRERFWKINS